MFSTVADSTGSVNLSLWDTTADWLQAGDIIRLKGAHCTLFHGSLILYSGRHGSIERIGEFTMVFTEVPNISHLQWTADPNNPNQFTSSPANSPNVYESNI